jgi:hypothetical protein
MGSGFVIGGWLSLPPNPAPVFPSGPNPLPTVGVEEEPGNRFAAPPFPPFARPTPPGTGMLVLFVGPGVPLPPWRSMVPSTCAVSVQRRRRGLVPE